ncbi:MAG: hypothetical protein DYH13_09620 [Alphaproteobacteria bacterium PRO2]|nr:hypothetical protein [Alphaproteobacteria bacterium PRO2]
MIFYKLEPDTAEKERNILRTFFDAIISMNPQDNTVSDSKAVRDAKNKLKTALRGSKYRCTCAKRTWGGPCELCQSSDNEVYSLRNFFRVIRDAKKHNLTGNEIQEFIENTKKHVAA